MKILTTRLNSKRYLSCPLKVMAARKSIKLPGIAKDFYEIGKNNRAIVVMRSVLQYLLYPLSN